MNRHPSASIPTTETALCRPGRRHPSPEKALAKHRQQRSTAEKTPPERSDIGQWIEKALREATEKSHKGQRHGQVCHDNPGGQELQHSQRSQPALESDKHHQSHCKPREPTGKLTAKQDRRDCHHQHGDTDDEGIKPMKPLEKHLNVHLTSREKGAVAERPVWTGKTGFHDPGCTPDHHQGNDRNNKMSRKLCQSLTGIWQG